MDRLETVLKYLNLTKVEWSSMNLKRREQLFKLAEKEIKRQSKAKPQKAEGTPQ
jgi:hypothetical protein